MEEKEELQCYPHNVSPIKKTEKVPYFDMCIQTENELLRGLCFAPVKHEEFKKAGDLKSPVKVRKFKLDKQSDNTVLVYSNVALDSVDDIDFQPKEISTTNNIGMISAINTNQMMAIKAKLLQKGGKKKVKTDDGEKSLVNAFLGDPPGTIKVTLWEPFSDLEEGKTYQFDKKRIQHQRYNLSNTKNWVQGCRDCFVQGECNSTF